ncbi:MFS general substrate transporter [Xylona heveae TC161]|uniref:MFS general substrate transporter n=1 Tax=Xylona heveae (strain CBS 132557 / TC161) TaxID=1328760 RepID=A0A165IQN7_XYLHT|nr:MFS general substrate transporter [Xylona heveae TC161]KZF25243.1 MFS general substrate transporter [Xylona heveae TC161]
MHRDIDSIKSKEEQSDGVASPKRADGKIEMQEEDCYEKLGFCFPTWKKWSILSAIFIVQSSMNYNSSVYPNAVPQIAEHFGVSLQAARCGQMAFLIAYAFGSELWAPWSEELGRWPIMQLSLFLVNIWQIPCALAPNFGTIIVGRFLGGISSAGGSVTLGMVADMWESDDQQYAVAFIVLSSVGGSVLGPIVGGFVEAYLDWRWNFWIQLIFGGFTQIIHFFVPETRASVLVDREAKKRRKAGEKNVYGPGELKEHRFSIKEILIVWSRPFEMFVREPIVLFLSLLSGFSDALIFTFLESFGPVFKQWGFGTVANGLAFISIAVGYIIAYISFLPWIHKDRKIRRRDPDALQPETRLWWLLFTAPLETIGLFGFAWTSLGPPHVHWIAPMIFACLIAIANYAIYMATIDYMVASYGPYSASATGGNALARDFLAGIAAMYATPFFENVGHKYHLEWPSTILAFIALFVAIPIYIFYWKGPQIRARSKFAQTLASDRKAHEVATAEKSREKRSRGGAAHLENV